VYTHCIHSTKFVTKFGWTCRYLNIILINITVLRALIVPEYSTYKILKGKL
jgi:hypothetical protein